MSQQKEIRGRARNVIYGDAAAITLSQKSVYSTAQWFPLESTLLTPSPAGMKSNNNAMTVRHTLFQKPVFRT